MLPSLDTCASVEWSPACRRCFTGVKARMGCFHAAECATFGGDCVSWTLNSSFRSPWTRSPKISNAGAAAAKQENGQLQPGRFSQETTQHGLCGLRRRGWVFKVGWETPFRKKTDHNFCRYFNIYFSKFIWSTFDITAFGVETLTVNDLVQLGLKENTTGYQVWLAGQTVVTL